MTRRSRLVDWMADRPMTVAVLWFVALALVTVALIRWRS